MIILTRLGGRQMALNPDLIERAEATPDTVLTMLDGHKIVIVEPVEELVELVREWRALIAARAFTLSRDQGASASAGDVRGPQGEPEQDGAPHLVAVRLQDGDTDDASGLHTLAAHAAVDSSLARVLRLARREG